MSDPEAYRRRQAERDANRKRTLWQRIKSAVSDSSLATQILIGLLPIAAALIGSWWVWSVTKEGNLATWEQGRAHLEVATAPESIIKITTDRDGVATIGGTLYLTNQGPSDAFKPAFDVAIGFERLANGFEFFDTNILEGGFIKPDKIATNAPPIGVPFFALVKMELWTPFNMIGGEIHVRARVSFTDIYKHAQQDDIEATTLWGGGQGDSLSFSPTGERLPFQHLEKRDMLPAAVRH
jgi:hypothetical protein